MKQLCLLIFCVSIFSCGETTGWKTKVDNLEEQLNSCTEALAAAEAEAPNKLGMIHNVFFWLKEDLSEADRAAFLQGVQSLKAISSAQKCYIGPPAPTEVRGPVDNTFDYALLVHFADVAAQDAYQIDPIHLKFVEDHQDKWTKVIVYDNDVLD